MRIIGFALCCALVVGCAEAPESEGEVPAAEPATGEMVYTRFCFSCHAAGIAGAPETGVFDEWADRMEKGMSSLLQSTKTGMGGMPPKGLCAQCSDAQLIEAIEHMLPEQQGAAP